MPPSYRVYSAGLPRRPARVRPLPPRLPKQPRLRHFSSRHRIGFPVTATPCAGAVRCATCFVAMVPQGSAPPFSPAGYRTDRLVPAKRLGRPPLTKVSLSELRPLSDSAHAPVQPWEFPTTGCSRPTGFGGPPLLPGYPAPLRSHRAFTRWGDWHLSRPVSGGLDLDKRFCRLPEVRRRPRPVILFAWTQAFVRAMPHTCALLLPYSFACRLGGSGCHSRLRRSALCAI